MSGSSSSTARAQRANKRSSTSTSHTSGRRGRRASSTVTEPSNGNTEPNTNTTTQFEPQASTGTNESRVLTDAQAEIDRLRAEVEAMRAAAEQAQALAAQAQAQAQAAQAQSQGAQIVPIPRPRGDAGKDWKLREAMGLGDDLVLYRNIARTVRYAAVEARINLDSPFKAIPVDKLANVYKRVRDTHEYLDRRRFPADWPTVELLKQFLKNHRKYDRKKGFIPPYSRDSRCARRGRASSPLPNIDQEDAPSDVSQDI